MAIIKCPKCGYCRQPQDDSVNPLICPACGIAYQKWLDCQRQENTPHPGFIIEPADAGGTEGAYEGLGMAILLGRTFTWIALFIWGWWFILAGINWVKINSSFMHNINLPFHEFGHLLFMPFGSFMHILGGSLFQVLLPLELMAAFIIQRGDYFAASVMLWWTGQSLIDISPYIADARDRLIPLVGGADESFHDWGNLLAMMNALDKAQTLARFSFGLGAILMLLSFGWGAYVLWQHRSNF